MTQIDGLDYGARLGEESLETMLSRSRNAICGRLGWDKAKVEPNAGTFGRSMPGPADLRCSNDVAGEEVRENSVSSSMGSKKGDGATK